MKTIATVAAVVLALGFQTANAAAPTVDARVAKLERQVKRLNTDMYKCLNNVVEVYGVSPNETLRVADHNGGDHALLVVNPACVN